MKRTDSRQNDHLHNEKNSKQSASVAKAEICCFYYCCTQVCHNALLWMKEEDLWPQNHATTCQTTIYDLLVTVSCGMRSKWHLIVMCQKPDREYPKHRRGLPYTKNLILIIDLLTMVLDFKNDIKICTKPHQMCE